MENDISLLSTENTCNNLIKNQESESMYVYESESSSSCSDDDREHRQQIRYIIFPKWTWKLSIISLIAIIVFILLAFFIIKHYFKKTNIDT